MIGSATSVVFIRLRGKHDIFIIELRVGMTLLERQHYRSQALRAQSVALAARETAG